MTSFEKFCKDLNSLSDSTTLPALQTQLSTGITGIAIKAVSIGAVFGGVVSGSKDKQAEKFSNEVANYTTSDEVISSLSKDIGKPKKTKLKKSL